jgi:hypothetical protein
MKKGRRRKRVIKKKKYDPINLRFFYVFLRGQNGCLSGYF